MGQNPKYFFIFNKNKSFNSFSLTREKLAWMIVSAVSLFVALLIVCFIFLSDFFYRSKIAHLKKNNTHLVSTIYELENRIKLAESELKVIAEKDRALRTYVDIPAIDRDVRKLGIGGKVAYKTDELDMLIPDDDLSVARVMNDLDRLSRLIKLEKISYESIYNAFKHRSAEILSTPSIRPVNIGYITDAFGYRIHPFSHKRQMHYGIDLSAPSGTSVFATADGVITSVKNSRTYGRQVEIDHGYGYTTFYAHLSKAHVKVNDVVKRGQIIAEVGCTGRSTGPHLHYEVRQFGIAVDPLDFFFTVYD